MASKQSKHQTTTGSQSKDGIRKPVRLTILAIIYALCIAAAIAVHAQAGVQRFMEDPAHICIWSACLLLCLIYHKKRSSYRVAAEHTVLPPLTVILLVTGYFPDVTMFLIIVTIITSIITARSLKIGILHAGTTLAPIPLIKILGLSLFGVGEWVGGWCWSGSLGGMDTTSLFTAALQLPDPWRVSGVEFRDEEDGRRELHIAIGFAAGSRFPCPEPGCGEAACPVHDARERVWRHLNFFQYKAFIHAGVPRVTCPAHGVHAVPVPWARPGSGFTLLFEAMVVELAKSQPVADIAEQVGEHDTRLWRFIRHYVDEARLYEDYTGVEAIGIDETSRKGHRYITVVADLVERNVICVVPGKDSTTIKRFARDFMDHNGDPDRVRLVTCDMSLGFAKGIRERLPNAARIIDKFHVIKHANEAVDKVRKQEARGNALLKRTKYLWLRNESNLTGLQLETKRSLQRRRLKTGRACQMRETLQDIYDTSADRAEAETALKRLCSWMTRSRLEPMKEFARQIRRHWRDILAYFDHPYTNAILEGLNSVIQNVKTRARGFKNMGYFSTMIYLTCGKLDLSTVTT